MNAVTDRLQRRAMWRAGYDVPDHRMTLVLLDDDAAPLFVARVPQGEARHEHRLRDLIFHNPAILPVHELDPGFGKIIAVTRELNVPGVGFIDVVLIDERGRLVIVECKLWRNPQARREVVGQILDYARELARFSYDDLQREVSSSTKRQGNVLHDLACEAGGTMEEEAFVDRVSRDLHAGRFLLLIVGDGITEGTRRIGEYLRAQPGLAFDFGLVELAEYRFTDPVSGSERLIMHPRLLARTAVIERAVIRSEVPGVVIEEVSDRTSPLRSVPGPRTEFQQDWRRFVERFIAATSFDDPGQPPPRSAGVGWMRVPLPGPSPLVLWRASGSGQIGAHIRYTGSEGLDSWEALEADRDAIASEFGEAGLAPPEWDRKDDEASVSVTLPSALPWDAAREDEQIELLGGLANRFLNSFRPRFRRLTGEGG